MLGYTYVSSELPYDQWQAAGRRVSVVYGIFVLVIPLDVGLWTVDSDTSRHSTTPK